MEQGFQWLEKSAAGVSKVWNFCGFCAFSRPKIFQGLECVGGVCELMKREAK